VAGRKKRNFQGHTCVLLGELLVSLLEVLFFGVAQDKTQQAIQDNCNKHNKTIPLPAVQGNIITRRTRQIILISL
jgi:hypothetical protein